MSIKKKHQPSPSLLSRKLSVVQSSSYQEESSPFGTAAANIEEEDLNTVLYASCMKNDSATVVTLLDENPALDKNVKRGRLGSTALFAAALRGNVGIVELLLSDVNTDVNLARDDGTTPLIIAAQEGFLEVVQMILRRAGVDVNKAYRGRSPLFMASYKNHADVVDHLVLHKADANQQESEGKLTPLMIAASKGHTRVVTSLLYADNIDVNLQDSVGQTALFIAALHGHSDVLQTLSVRRDIDGSITRNADSSSPLQVACMMSHSSDIIATILATRNTNVHWINEDGFTAMHIAENAGVHDVVTMLGLLGAKSSKLPRKDELCSVCRVM